ncbi:MAG: DUF4240 domain-containing protein [Planctomycetia bacterium]|nr:DUF4240 domain-containing protein [Planctomycetia bacterium]
MTEAKFWKLIARLDWDRTGDHSAVVHPVVQALVKLPAEEIREFDEILAEKLYALDTVDHARHIGSFAYPHPGFSADGFLYSRCVAVANGKVVYERVLADPSLMPKDMEFESLLSMGWKAFEKKTGKEYDRLTRLSFETFSNRAGWARVKGAAEAGGSASDTNEK